MRAHDICGAIPKCDQSLDQWSDPNRINVYGSANVIEPGIDGDLMWCGNEAWKRVEHSLDSAGDGGFIVSGLTQSDGDGERSRFVVMWPKPSANPVE